jgi:hypothetical protein
MPEQPESRKPNQTNLGVVSRPGPTSAWEMVLGGVTVRKYLRKLRCFISGHRSVHISCNILQCARCHAVTDQGV